MLDYGIRANRREISSGRMIFPCRAALYKRAIFIPPGFAFVIWPMVPSGTFTMLPTGITLLFLAICLPGITAGALRIAGRRAIRPSHAFMDVARFAPSLGDARGSIYIRPAVITCADNMRKDTRLNGGQAPVLDAAVLENSF